MSASLMRIGSLAVGCGLVAAACGETLVPVSAPFTAVSAGVLHSCGLTEDGAIYCWGWNQHGQLGDGSAGDRTVPVRTDAGQTVFAAVSAGGGHTCGLATDGTAYCWGLNLTGQLGDGSGLNRERPVPVDGGLDFGSISAGGVHTCGVATGLAAYCWGFNDDGQLGDGSQESRSGPVAVEGGIAFTQVSAGGFHTCGITPSGEAYCWGRNARGQLGTGTTRDTLLPAAVAGGPAFVAITAGFEHSCALDDAGVAWCWGSNLFGQLGIDASTTVVREPTAVAGGHTFAVLDAGAHYACGVTTEGAGFCWGFNNNGQQGTDSASTCVDPQNQANVACNLAPVPVEGGLTFASVSAATQHTCALTADSVAYCWGLGTLGQLGNGRQGDNVFSIEPVRVSGQL